MLRSSLVCFLACLASSVWASTCPQHYAAGKPPVIAKASLEPLTREVCFRAFAVMHSGVSRTPLWAAERLVRTGLTAAEALSRRDAFHAEPRLARSQRAELADYARSGYDRGHMAPSGDMPTRAAQAESFSLANTVPQVHANNAGVWAGIEAAVRAYAVREGEVYVVTGPAFIGTEVKSLKNRVLVPTHVWKVVYSPRSRQAGAYLITNDATRVYSALSVSELERRVGLKLLPGVPQRIRDTAVALPVPGRDALPPRRKKSRDSAPAGSGPGDYSLSDLARRTLDKLVRQLTK